jgi:hypothetical protein
VTAVGALRAVLAAIEAGELSCSAAYRNRLQGAVVVVVHCAAQVGAPSKSADHLDCSAQHGGEPLRGARSIHAAVGRVETG